MNDETKGDRFRRIATKRTVEVLNSLRKLGNCSNRSVYEYSDAETRKIFGTIEKRLAEVKARFKRSGESEFRL